MSVKEQSFTVPVNGKVENYDGWCVACDQEGCKNTIIVSKQVIPYEYADKRQLDNGTFNIPWNDVENDLELSEYLYDNTDWRMDKSNSVWCFQHSKLIKETAVKETKRIFDGLSENVGWFKELVDDKKAGINYAGEGFHINDDDWSADFTPVKGDGKMNLLVHNEFLFFEPSITLFEADSFEEIGDLIAELND